MKKTHFWNFAIEYWKYGEILKGQKEEENMNIIHFSVVNIKQREYNKFSSLIFKHLYFQCFVISCKLLFEKYYLALKFASIF